MKLCGIFVSACVLAAVAAGCGASPPSRSEVLDDIAEGMIIPAYESLAEKSAEFLQESREFCANPSLESLTEAREALMNARSAWKETEAVWVGPVMSRRSWAVIDWPINVGDITRLLDDESVVLDFDRLSKRVGADQRGFGTAEYFLYESGAGQDVLATFANPRRCRYLTGVAEVASAEADLLVPDWAISWDDGGPYKKILLDPDGSGMDALVNNLIFLLERITDLELGNALGEMGGEVDVLRIPEGPAGLGATDLRDRLLGARRVLIGDASTSGLGPLLAPDTVSQLEEQFNAVSEAVSAVGGPLRESVRNSPESVARISEGVKAIKRTVATNVVSRLGVRIGFSDADGDSAG